MDRKNFGWREALNNTGERIEKDGAERDARLGIRTPVPREDERESESLGWDVWWSVALAHVFLAGVVLMVLVRSFAS